MTIKETIVNFCNLLKNFEISVHPETLRLCKFNDPSALEKITKFLIETVNFISSNCRSHPSKISTNEELIEVSKLAGFTYWQSIETSSYSCLLFLVWIIENIGLLPLFEQKIYEKLRTVLNCQPGPGTPPVPHSEHDDVYEALASHHYRSLQLQRAVREFYKTYLFNCSSTTTPSSNFSIPSASSGISGTTVFDIFVQNSGECSSELDKLEQVITSVDLLTKFYNDYSTFKKWVSSVNYNLPEDSSPESQLISQIIDMQSRIQFALSQENPDEMLDYLFFKSSSDSDNLPNHVPDLDHSLQEMEARISEQKQVIRRLLGSYMK